MKLLLDTNAFLFACAEPDRLSVRAREAIVSPTNDRILSAVSIWEIAIKVGNGKLRLARPLDEMLNEQATSMRLSFLDLTRRHATEIRSLPLHHRDPFDRALIAQARVEDATILTVDRWFGAYEVDVLW